MKKASLFIIPAIALCLGACITSGPKSKYSKATDILKEDTYESSAQIDPVFVGKTKAVTRKISGRIYCGEGLKQVPANKATLELKNKDKIVRTLSTEPDGTYSFSSTFELVGPYSFAINSRCGKMLAILPSDLSHDLENQDFWIK